MNILDISENSVRAGADLVRITVDEDPEADSLTISIGDNGCGMDDQLLKSVCDPFTTTRTTRKVGMGVPLFKAAAEDTGGSFRITSVVGEGTEVTATFGYSHIDRVPLGDMASTISTLIQCHPDTDFLYTHSFRGKSFYVDTRELKTVLEGVPLWSPDVSLWIREFINENLKEIYMEEKQL